MPEPAPPAPGISGAGSWGSHPPAGNGEPTPVLNDAVARLFRSPAPGPSGRPRVGLEAEFIPVRSTDCRPVRPRSLDDGRPGTVQVLRDLASEEAWLEEPTSGGLPRFRTPEGGILSFEPGGQLEYSSRPCDSLARLDAELLRVTGRIQTAMGKAGIRLLARGLDPRTPPHAVRMELEGDRYPRQQAHYDQRGPDGRTMMLQTAGLHVNADPATQVGQSWAVANTIAPHLIAIFANAPVRPGDTRVRRSHRAGLWRTLDPSRNRVFPPSESPADAYREFALSAESFLLASPGQPSRPFREHAEAIQDPLAVAQHLTTLFPEVRPRGYLEFRGADALPARWCIVPAAVVMAALHWAPLTEAILRRIPAPSHERLVAAGDQGLGHPELGPESRWLMAQVLAALPNMDETLAGPGITDRVDAFVREFTARGRDPGHAESSWLDS